jgi:hypothetical protein
MLALAVAGACVRPGHLSSGCKLRPSEGVWTSTSVVGRIEGTALDMQEDVPIGNLEFRLEGTERSVRTDAKGAFHFDSVPDGRVVVASSGSVYQARRDTLMLPTAGGMRGTLRLSTPRDVLRHCDLYHP